MEKADVEQQPEFDSAGVQAALETLKLHPEPEVGFMVMGRGTQPAYNMQSAVDAENALVIAHELVLDAADSRSLEPMAQAAKTALGSGGSNVVADAGYSNAEQAANCEAKGILPCVPAIRTRILMGTAPIIKSTSFAMTYTYVSPGGKTLRRRAVHTKDKSVMYAANPQDCGPCALKQQCTSAPQRRMSRHIYEDARERMNQRATPAIMRLRRSVVEHPFATLKYRIFGHPRLLLRGLSVARTEIGFAVMVYNLKRMANVLGTAKMIGALRKV